MYNLCELALGTRSGGSKVIAPVFPLQVIPANSSDILFKFWGTANYDRHDAFSVDWGFPILAIKYEILYDGKVYTFEHPFKCRVIFTQHGIRGDRVIMKPYGNDLEGLPKLPGDWQYFQFIG